MCLLICMNPVTLIPLWLLLLLLLMSTTKSVTGQANTCLNKIETGPIYQENLFKLLVELKSNSSHTTFYNTSLGEPPNQVYGQYLCRLRLEFCLDHISRLADCIHSYCPNQTEATVWTYHAMLRFSNYPFFGEYKSGAPNSTECSPNAGSFLHTTTESDGFKGFMEATLQNLAGEVYAGEHGERRYAMKDVDYTSPINSDLSFTVHALAECTPDLSSNDCSSCLKTWAFALPTMCNGSEGALVLYSSSCYIIYSTLDDLRNYTSPDLASAPAPVSLPHSVTGRKIPTRGVILAVAPIACVLATSMLIFCLLRRKARRATTALNPESAKIKLLTPESLQYDLVTIQLATENFSDKNKIGKGGFGIVYKGMLENGQEIAVKRLTTNSEHNTEEFKNEVVLVAKLQHRNLVRLMGFCLAGEEKLLVFEFVPNKSLDYFLFDQAKKEQLDWKRRYKIIEGVARGLLYLHEDSRHRIIHRDLKAGNILLDADMMPKISDFGTARLVGMDASLNETQRVAGTLGYMAPEYILQGQFSVKSDVYSFGVLTLEIISGKRVRSFDQSGIAQNLLNDAWNCWNSGGEFEFMDETLRNPQYSSTCNEVRNCFHLGLLCVQADIDKRPTMASVVNRLNSLSLNTLPVPQQPAYISNITTESSSGSVTKGTKSQSSMDSGPRY